MLQDFIDKSVYDTLQDQVRKNFIVEVSQLSAEEINTTVDLSQRSHSIKNLSENLHWKSSQDLIEKIVAKKTPEFRRKLEVEIYKIITTNHDPKFKQIDDRLHTLDTRLNDHSNARMELEDKMKIRNDNTLSEVYKLIHSNQSKNDGHRTGILADISNLEKFQHSVIDEIKTLQQTLKDLIGSTHVINNKVNELQTKQKTRPKAAPPEPK